MSWRLVSMDLILLCYLLIFFVATIVISCLVDASVVADAISQYVKTWPASLQKLKTELKLALDITHCRPFEVNLCYTLITLTCSFLVGILVTLGIMWPVMTVLQALATRRLMLSIYDDLRHSRMGYEIFYNDGTGRIYKST